ncbi:cell division protein ZipA C-terminal FtsZ-binding domain-containing protein [Thiofilum flexile]|uniref:cell division protein ZipA C-terminal FtsZ-binding domain-containing protein n=1 Tax=Thiofilum flexile TaxID=125627 RepID=UPI000379677C|nr:cell division protein ZipA C-terminal FtsZ-binding domain-containing protein [Thiofilum flexile]
MEIVSLGIMVLGLVALLAIYIISRISQKDHMPKGDMPVVPVKDAEGQEMSSIMEDNPSLYGKPYRTQALGTDNDEPLYDNLAPEASGKFQLPPRLVLFIAAPEGQKFEGVMVLEALANAGLQFGEMRIFHRMVLTDEGEVSLFSVANGVPPWTLDPDELKYGATPGLSLIINLPSPLDDSEAIHDFIYTAERINQALGGILKDQYQEVFTPEMRDQVLHFLGV